LTVIAAKVYKGKVVMAADSQVSSVTESFKSAKNFSKLIRFKNFTIGYCGSATIFHMLRDLQRDKIFQEKSLESPNQVFNLTKPIFEQYAKTLNKFFTPREQLETAELLLCSSSRIFACDETFCMERSDYFSIGSGSSYALGALHSGATPEKAVSAAIEFSLGCGGEVSIVEVG
jgi:ATP-dependent protease HslVU (ClpYQ) peptidase subunit